MQAVFYQLHLHAERKSVTITTVTEVNIEDGDIHNAGKSYHN